MRVDMRDHAAIRSQVHAGLSALRVQGRQIWGDTRHSLPEIVTRLMVGVGDLARLARDGDLVGPEATEEYAAELSHRWRSEVGKELGNILFSTIRWIDDLGFDPLACLDLAIEAQEKFAKSGRPR